MADKYYQAGWRTDGLLDPMLGPSDAQPAGAATGKYQEGWPADRVALPDASSDPGFARTAPDTSNDWTFAKGLRDHANQPPWSLEKSSLNMLLDKHELQDIFGNGTGPADTTVAAPDNGFYTGLQPYVPDPKGPVGSGDQREWLLPQTGRRQSSGPADHGRRRQHASGRAGSGLGDRQPGRQSGVRQNARSGCA